MTAQERDEAFKQLYADGLTDPQAAEVLECSEDAIYRIRKRLGFKANGGNNARKAPPPPESPDTCTFNNGEAISPLMGRVMSLDELLEKANVDLSVWEVERHVINKYEQASKDDAGRIRISELFQIKAFLKRNQAAADLSALAESLIDSMKEHAPTYPAYAEPVVSDERFLLEVSPFDLHIGKLAWKPETGDNYDSRIARNLLMNAVEDLLAKAKGFPLERILFPVGNDLMQTDTNENTTTGGTRQDVDSRHHKMFVAAYEVMVAAIDRLMTVAPVKVLIVPGNHDRANALKLGVVLEAHYRNTDRVEVDSGPNLRKYETYGVNLLGYTHGNEERHADLPLIMAQEKPKEWARAEHKEWHLGHLHKRKQQNFTAGDTHQGVVVRVLPSLSGTDAWHAMKGYVKGQRAAEAYLWSFENGYAGHFSSNVTGKRKAA